MASITATALPPIIKLRLPNCAKPDDKYRFPLSKKGGGTDKQLPLTVVACLCPWEPTRPTEHHQFYHHRPPRRLRRRIVIVALKRRIA